MSRLRWKKGVHWDVFEANSTDGSMQIQGVDARGRDDYDAVLHLIAAAQRGSKVAIDALWEVLPYDGLVNRVLWQMADPRIKSVAYPPGYYEKWNHLYEENA
jgi:hypothetical protein